MTYTDFHWPFPRLWSFLLGRYARPRQVALLWVLATAVEKRVPLAPVIDAFADDTYGPWRLQARELARAIEAGTPLPAALEAVPGAMPRSVELAAHVGAQSGAMGPALRAEAAALMNERQAGLGWLRSFLLLYLSVLFVQLGVVTFIVYYIVPKFRAIFEDFQVELPRATEVLVFASDFVVAYFYIVLPIVGAAFWFAVFVDAPGQFLSVGGVTSRFFHSLSKPGVLRNLSVVVAAQRPLSSGMDTLASFHPVARVRRRLLGVSKRIEAGDDCWLCMRDAGLINGRESAVLESAQRVGNLAWALDLIAHRINRRIEYRLLSLFEVIRPLLVAAIGVEVGFVVIAMFLPLIKLINDLT